MYVTFTDWDFDGNVENAIKNLEGFWPTMKDAGAVSTRATITSPTTIRTMTIWNSEADVDANIDEIRAAAGSAVGMSVTGGMRGDLATELG